MRVDTAWHLLAQVNASNRYRHGGAALHLHVHSHTYVRSYGQGCSVTYPLDWLLKRGTVKRYEL